MNELMQALLDLVKTLRPWVIVVPWEQGVRIRFGRYRKRLDAGFYFKIPIVDKIYVLPVRRQFVNVAPLDLEDSEGRNLTVAITVGFNISDVEKVLDSVSQPEDAVSDLVASFTSRYFRENDVILHRMEEGAKKDLQGKIPGLSNISVAVTMFSRDKRIRLIMDQRWSMSERIKMGES